MTCKENMNSKMKQEIENNVRSWTDTVFAQKNPTSTCNMKLGTVEFARCLLCLKNQGSKYIK